MGFGRLESWGSSIQIQSFVVWKCRVWGLRTTGCSGVCGVLASRVCARPNSVDEVSGSKTPKSKTVKP